MLRTIFIIGLIMCIIQPLYAEEDTIGPGEALSFGFYTNIHNNIDGTIDTLRKKELSKYSTFSGFGSHCRAKNPALDGEKMDEKLLIEVSYGGTSRLMSAIAKNNGAINSNSLINLASCLGETYKRLGEQAVTDENMISQIGMIGLYSDGDTTNSDYDIIADIEKINSIIFSEKLDYKGTKNTVKSSYDALARGDTIPNILEGMSGVTLSGGIVVGTPVSGLISSITTPPTITPTPSSLGIGTTCSVSIDTTVSSSPITDMVDDRFLQDLSNVLGGVEDTRAPSIKSHTYNTNLPTKNTLPLSESSKTDFFDTPPCSSNFCIKVKKVNSGGDALAGGKTHSIESLIDKHSKIMEPIANSNLSFQKHQKNSFQLPFLNIKFKNIIAGANLSTENSAQLQKKYKEEYTQSMQDQEFENMRRCAYVSAGLPSDKDRANIPQGVSYQFLTTQTTENTSGAKKIVGVINPEDSSISANCMKIALGKPREEYYSSLSTDLTELEVFTSALISQIGQSINTDKKLDTLRTK